jgi:hypothetical protein
MSATTQMVDLLTEPIKVDEVASTGSKLSGLAIAGIVLGLFAFLFILVIIAYYVAKNKNK